MRFFTNIRKTAIACFTILCITSSLHAGVVVGTIGTIDDAYSLDFNNDGTAEFFIYDAGSPFTVMHTNAMLTFTWSEGGNNIWTNGSLSTGGWDDIKPLTANTSIGAAGNWQAQGDAYIVNYQEQTLFHTGESYIGFRIKINGNVHYAWAKVNISGSLSTGLQIDWLQCAYETTPNAPISAGNTGTGIAENTMGVYVTPNPTCQWVDIYAPVEDASHVAIYDLSGKRIQAPISITENNMSIDMRALRSGIYFVTFDNHTIRVIKK